MRLSSTTTPPEATSSSARSLGTHLRGRAALPAAAVEEEQAERRFRRQELVPVMEDAHARVIGEEPAAAAARSSSSSTVTSSASGSIADAIQAEPTPVPVPISAKRPRGWAAASSAKGAARRRGSTSARSASRSRAPLRGGLAAAQASAFLRGFSPRNTGCPTSATQPRRTSDGLRVAERVDDLERDHERACPCGGSHLQDELSRSRTDRPARLASRRPAATADN